MKLTLTLSLDNSAFEPDPEDSPTSPERSGREIARILYRLASSLVESEHVVAGDCGRLADINGNVCGEWSVTHTRRSRKSL